MKATLPTHPVIVVGRSFGAGGRELGHALAKRLGFDYYDKELLNEAATHSGLDAGIFERNDERAPGFLSGMLPLNMGFNALAWYAGPSSTTSQGVYHAQSDFIRHIASKGPCVIVGRTADYLLRDFPGLLSIFLHAPEQACVERIMKRTPIAAEEALSTLKRTNRLRAEYYNFYTDRTWGQANTYHLTFDTSRIPIDDIVELIVAHLERKEKAQR